MTRLADTDGYRSFAQMKAVSPVGNAFRALACLSEQDRAALVARFNGVFGGNRPDPLTIQFHTREN